MSELKVNTITNAAGGNTAQINGMTPTADSLQGFRNRIINGNMVIDQRNAGASVTPTDGQYVLDRFQQLASAASKYSVQQNAGSVTPPVGFTNYLGCTSLSAYSISASDYFAIRHSIEGFNVADLGWGTANAATVTLSFWVRSSLTGTFGGSFRDNAGTRAYPFTYTISAANTFEYKTITIAGDTSGTWATNNARSVLIQWGLGVGSSNSGTAGAWNSSGSLSATGATSVVGTSGATFYITGIQLEAGSVATPFERIDYGRQLIQCQRYYFRTADNGTLTNIMAVSVETSTNAAGGFSLPVTMRAVPSITLGSGVGFFSAASGIRTPTILSNRSSNTTFSADFTIAGATAGQSGSIYRQTTNGFVEASSEL